MVKDDVLRSCLLFVGAVVVVVGICTFSFKKMVVAYVFGLLAVAGLVLPDWEFFRRDFSQWNTPLQPVIWAGSDSGAGVKSERYGFYPLRVILFTDGGFTNATSLLLGIFLRCMKDVCEDMLFEGLTCCNTCLGRFRH